MKLWKKVLLKVPKVGLAYRAFRWQKTVRKFKIIKVTRLINKLRKAAEENPDMFVKALKSKTVWLGISQEFLALFQLYANGGEITAEVVMPAIAGILTIIVRFATTGPVAAK